MLARTQKKILAAGTAGLVLLACYVPWTHTYHSGGTHREKPAGYHFIFRPPPPERDHPAFGVRIEVPQVLIPMAVVLIAAGAGVALTRKAQVQPPSSPPDRTVSGRRAESDSTGRTATDPRSSAGRCWFCKGNEADGTPESVQLTRVVERNLLYIPTREQEVWVEIPRCAACHQRHDLGCLLYIAPGVVGFIAYCLTPWLDLPDWLVISSLVFMMGTYVLAPLIYHRRMSAVTAEFPQVKVLLDAGWKM